ncbi:MAG: hypothetical protein F4Z41_04960, partial [Acidimicrobiia bacterium]|nr:hypothetical protein [Acidimicrobiia bacterium]MYD40782.1 hypothetical protein [Acidimicrobiia bacterium]
MNYISCRRFSFQPSTQQSRRRMSALTLALTVVAFLAVQALSPYQSVADAGENADSTPGPCEDGYVAPTPVAVAVTGVPVVVTS